MPIDTGDNGLASDNAPIVVAFSLLALFSCGLLLSGALMGSLARASDFTPRLYEIVTETGMPHLEENLRYTTTREQRCLAPKDLTSAFPVLSHAALKGCTLGDETRQDDTISYVLACEGGHGTTGAAVWRIGEHQIRGTLNVRLGGKNLTFYQRVTGKVLGECGAGSRPVGQ